MAQHNETGKLGEDIACTYLTKKGYKIHHRNWRFGKGEIDIIAQDKNTYVFVEVKTRHSDYMVEPETAVTLKKQKLIIKTTERFLISKNIENWSRFDIISIIIHPQGHEIRHLKEAFTA